MAALEKGANPDSEILATSVAVVVVFTGFSLFDVLALAMSPNGDGLSVPSTWRNGAHAMAFVAAYKGLVKE